MSHYRVISIVRSSFETYFFPVNYTRFSQGDLAIFHDRTIRKRLFSPAKTAPLRTTTKAITHDRPNFFNNVYSQACGRRYVARSHKRVRFSEQWGGFLAVHTHALDAQYMDMIIYRLLHIHAHFVPNFPGTVTKIRRSAASEDVRNYTVFWHVVISVKICVRCDIIHIRMR